MSVQLQRQKLLLVINSGSRKSLSMGNSAQSSSIVEIYYFFCNCNINYHPTTTTQSSRFQTISTRWTFSHLVGNYPVGGKLMLLANCSDLQYFKKNRNSMKQQTRDYILVYLRVNGCSFWFNIFQIMSTISMLTLLYLQITHYLTAVQIFITLMVVLDLAMRLLTEGLVRFAGSWDNRIHLLILALLATSICWDLMAAEASHHDGGIIAGVFLFIRYSVQISRLFRLILDSKKQLQISHQQEVNLNESIELESSERTH